MDKLLIKRQFSKASATYNDNAHVQRYIAEKTIRLMCQYVDSTMDNIFEFGCGSGFLSRSLIENFCPKYFLLNDLCEEAGTLLSDILSENYVFVHGDAEKITLDRPMDAIVSCSTIQWFKNPFDFLVRMKPYLAKNGYLIISTFGECNLREIKEITGCGLHYYPKEYMKLILDSQYEILCAEEELVTMKFQTPMEVLYHLKATGVNSFSQRVFTKTDLKQIGVRYREFMEDDSYLLTYHPIYLILKSK